MSATWVIPELGADFPTNFAKMVIDYVYQEWSIIDPAKPATMQGQSQVIEFRTGLPSEFKSMQVLSLQGGTRAVEYSQIGNKRIQMHTYVNVMLKVKQLERDDVEPILTNMERELIRICGQYRPSDIVGIKEIIYDSGERVYEHSDTWAKSTWKSNHSIRLWYEYVDIS